MQQLLRIGGLKSTKSCSSKVIASARMERRIELASYRLPWVGSDDPELVRSFCEGGVLQYVLSVRESRMEGELLPEEALREVLVNGQ